jgi:dihydroxy-acid dehydratase
MEDFCYAGGLPAVLRELLEAGLLHEQAITVNGSTIGDNVRAADNWNREVVRPFSSPLKANAGIAVLTGNLAPSGAIIKPAAASPALLQHRGRAVVFESIEDFRSRIDDPDLDIDRQSVMVLKNCGPRGYPGMPEVANMQLPKKILAQGVRDLVRISDARMSGTAYGTVVLHVAPEAAAGGPLALVHEGDFISLNVAERSLMLEVDETTLAQRRLEWRPPELPARGYARMYVENVLQADEGADLGFLAGGSGVEVTRDPH